VAADETALALMQDTAFDPAAEIVLAADERKRQLVGVIGEQAIGNSASAHIVSYKPEAIEIKAELATPGYLVLADAWYPGWEATVDGEPAPIQRADLLFRAVALDAGRHRIVFTFRPVSLRIGAGVSLAGLVGLIVVVAQSLLLSKADRSVIMGATKNNSQEGKL
jgi:hypothetical protein